MIDNVSGLRPSWSSVSSHTFLTVASVNAILWVLVNVVTTPVRPVSSSVTSLGSVLVNVYPSGKSFSVHV